MARLIILHPSGTTRQVSLAPLPFTVGRVPESDLMLDRPEVSRLHAMFELAPSGLQVRDMDSSNGMLLNGKRIKSAPLTNGDQLRIGPFTLRYLSSSDDITEEQAFRLVTIPGRLSELDLKKLAPPSPPAQPAPTARQS